MVNTQHPVSGSSAVYFMIQLTHSRLFSSTFFFAIFAGIFKSVIIAWRHRDIFFLWKRWFALKILTMSSFCHDQTGIELCVRDFQEKFVCDVIVKYFFLWEQSKMIFEKLHKCKFLIIVRFRRHTSRLNLQLLIIFNTLLSRNEGD